MLVAEILKSKGEAVFTVSPEDSVSTAAEQLVNHRVGALIVCEADRVVGVLSERDVVRALAHEGACALAQPVSAHMTSAVIFAEPGESVDILLERMTDRRIRHLPVLRNGRLCGVVSIGDLVKHRIDAVTREAESLKSYILTG